VKNISLIDVARSEEKPGKLKKNPWENWEIFLQNTCLKSMLSSWQINVGMF
jgi:hypothetical protein